MRLKQIKLAGFKSFVDPTKIPFDNALSAIIGPNGCGKSNLLEAVIDASDAWFQRRLAARLAGRSGLDSLRERIRAHLDTVRESRVPTVALFLLIIDSAATLPGLRPRVQRLNERWRQGILRDLDSGRAAGDLPAELDTERHAVLILSAMHGVAVQALIGLGDEEIIACPEWELLDDIVQVSDREAFLATRELAGAVVETPLEPDSLGEVLGLGA